MYALRFRHRTSVKHPGPVRLAPAAILSVSGRDWHLPPLMDPGSPGIVFNLSIFLKTSFFLYIV